jgi:hypothetical protein
VERDLLFKNKMQSDEIEIILLPFKFLKLFLDIYKINFMEM